ncbi:MAG: TonB-dependent siderophore receptor [Pseudomonadota bacterium]
MEFEFDTVQSALRRNRSHNSGLHVRALTLGVAAAISFSAHAQTAATNTEMTEVLVSAKRVIDSGASALGTRTLRDTPFSVTAISSEDIEKHQAASLAAVFSKDASVAREGGTDYNMYAQRIAVRGLSLDWVNSVRVNGLPLTYYGATLPLESVEEVQLLKGSSGFLYGVGAPGGIVNYLTKRPTDQPLLNFSVGYRSDQLFSQHLDVGGRVGDGGFGYRINLVNEQGNTYADSDVDRKAATANFEVPITDNLKWVTDLLYQDSQIARPEPLFVLDTTVYRDERLPDPVDATRRLASDQSFSNTEFASGTTGLEWRISDGWDLNVNYGKTYTEYRFPYETFRLRDQGGTYVNRLADYYDVFNYDFARALVQGHFDTGPVSHHLTGGVSWQDLIITYGTTNYTPVDQPGGNLYDYSPETWANVYDGTPPHSKGSHYLEKSAYLSDTVGLTEKLSFLAGLRFTQYLQESYNVNTGARTSVYEKDVTTPTLALIYKPQESVTSYLSYVQSLQQGPIVGTSYVNAGELLNPIESDQYELGVKVEKTTWALSAAVFRLSKGATYVNSANYTVQGGEQLYDGVELGGRVRLGESWTVGTSVVVLDAKYTKGVNDWLLDRRLPGASKVSGAFDINYDVPALAGLSVHADVKYLGDKVVNHIQAGDLSVYSPGYAVANFGGNWRTKVAGRDVAFNAEVRNLLDRRYWDGATSAFSPGAPRTVAVNARVDF